MSALAAISPRRRRTDSLMRSTLLLGTLVALVPLVLILYYLLAKGLKVWSWDFFSTDPKITFLGDLGGIKSALLGTVEITLIASAVAIPLGVATAVWLTEYGKQSRFASLVRYFIDVMTGVPSIVFGLFIYITLVITTTQGYAAYKGSLALALLMFPVVVRSAEVVLGLVPDSLREAALALGAPRWRVTGRVVLRTAFPGLVTGCLLAIARAAGETAPLLYVVQLTSSTELDPSGPMNNVPFLIFSDIKASDPRKVAQAWGAALALVVGILALNLFARWIAARSRPVR